MGGTMETFAYEVFAADVNGRIEYKPQTWRTTTSSSLQDRANNAIKYVTPNVSGFTGHAMLSFGEQSSVATCTVSCAALTSYALKYSSDKLKGAYVHDSITHTLQSVTLVGDGVSGSLNTLYYGTNSIWAAGMDAVQRDIITASYDFGPALVSYIYAKSFQSDSASNTTHTYGVKVPFEKITLALSYGTGSVTSAQTAGTSSTNTLASDGTLSDTTLGVYYNFDKSTQLYALYSKSSSTGLARYDSSNTVAAFGARYNF